MNITQEGNEVTKKKFSPKYYYTVHKQLEPLGDHEERELTTGHKNVVVYSIDGSEMAVVLDKYLPNYLNTEEEIKEVFKEKNITNYQLVEL